MVNETLSSNTLARHIKNFRVETHESFVYWPNEKKNHVIYVGRYLRYNITGDGLRRRDNNSRADLLQQLKSKPTTGQFFNLYGSFRELLLRSKGHYLCECGNGFLIIIKIERWKFQWLPKSLICFSKPIVFPFFFLFYVPEPLLLFSCATKLRQRSRARRTHLPLTSTSLAVCKSG